MVVQLYNDIKYNVLYFEKSLFCLKKTIYCGENSKDKKKKIFIQNYTMPNY